MTKPRKKRSKQPQPDDAPDRRPPRKSERAIARERYVHDDKQANRPVARSRKSTSAHASPDPEGGGQAEASRLGRAGERGQGERKRKMKDTGNMSISSSHHPPSPHQASIASRTSRRYIKGTSTSSRRHPVAIASRSNQPPPSYHIGAVPVPAAISSHPKQQDGKDDRGTADRPWPWHHIQSTIRSRLRHRHGIMRQANSPANSPSPDTKSGAMKRDDEGRTENDEARTTGNITRWVSKQTAETDDIPMTSPERARHDQR